MGGVYAAGQWGLQRMMEASERGRKQTGAKNDLLNRFNLNLQDAQFTVQALLPTVASQLQFELHVEERTNELAEIAKAERIAKAHELERQNKERVEREASEKLRFQEDERRKAETQEEYVVAQEKEENSSQDGITNENSKESPEVIARSAADTTTLEDGRPVPNGASNTTRLTLNPAAPAFQPRFSAPPVPPTASAQPEEDFPKLNGHPIDSPPSDDKSTIFASASSDSGDSEETKTENGEVPSLGKSWAEVVKTKKENESAENGGIEAVLPEISKIEALAETKDIAERAGAESNTSQLEAENLGGNVVNETTSTPAKSKIQLWNEIKIFSFTRLLTSIYVLSLLTLQTHVQLALLGRAHYVQSLIDALPPRSSPSSNSSQSNVKGEGRDLGVNPAVPSDEDLEAALYQAKELPIPREEDRVNEDVERKYLTFSWWLLHEGWKGVRERVQEKVEEVVGPMVLKTPVVYGELSALLGEIRKRVETETDGSRFDFSAALHPPTLADEIHTLEAGGGFAAPAPSSPSSSSAMTPNSIISRPLRSLLNETSDFLLSPDGSLVLTLTLDRLYSLSVSKLEPAFSTPVASSTSALGDGARGARFEDVTEKQTKLASLLPVLTKLSAGGLEGQDGILRGGHGNEYIEAIDDIRELREFVAIVYASYDRDNLRAAY